jgi:cyclase
MSQNADHHSHAHHPHSHEHSHPHNHAVAGDGLTSRRDFLRVLMGGALAGASILELAYHRAAWARAAAPGSDSNLFDIQHLANGIYFAQARPQAMLNCNAAIFVRSKDVVVVDTHSKPSAAASLIGQMKREVTPKPVRYVINTHFHWDHTQGSAAYRRTGEKVDFIASAATRDLMAKLSVDRMKASVGAVPKQIDGLRKRAAHSTSAAEKAFCADQVRQLEAYLAELKDYTPELPTITFDKSYVLKDPAYDLHIDFRGHAHTAGDVVVFCPQERAIATGDVIHGFLPFIADGFPRIWPGTIDAIGQADFRSIMPGHAALQTDRTVMTNLRNYIEELTGKVEQGKKAGWTVAEMQQRITVASLKSLHSNGYAGYLARMSEQSHSHFERLPPLQNDVNVNIGEIYRNLDRT